MKTSIINGSEVSRLPVAIQLATPSGALVITYEGTVPCDKIPIMQPLIIDEMEISYTCTCTPLTDSNLVSYSVSDPETVDYVLSKLRADFTVVLNHNIKVWSGNINHPLYGKGNWTRN